jgi:hypothetical protein
MSGAPQVAMRIASQIWHFFFASQTLQVFCFSFANPSDFLFGPSQKGTICSSEKLVSVREHPWVLGQATGTWTHKIHHGLDSGEATTFPHIVFSAALHGGYIQMALFPGTPKLESRNCPDWSPGTLGAHNSRLQSPIAMRSEPKL